MFNPREEQTGRRSYEMEVPRAVRPRLGSGSARRTYEVCRKWYSVRITANRSSPVAAPIRSRRRRDVGSTADSGGVASCWSSPFLCGSLRGARGGGGTSLNSEKKDSG